MKKEYIYTHMYIYLVSHFSFGSPPGIINKLRSVHFSCSQDFALLLPTP